LKAVEGRGRLSGLDRFGHRRLEVGAVAWPASRSTATSALIHSFNGAV
jgi:hypothetical protein